MFSQALVAALAAFAAVADAAPQRGNGSGWGSGGNSSPSSRCYTTLGRTSVRGGVPTSYTTTTLPCTSTRTTTVTSTSSPPPSTSTVTTSTIVTSTAPTSILTSTVSTTLTATTTTVSTVTETATTTETTSVASTSTVPAPAGFIPMQTSLPGTSYDGSGGSSPVVKRHVSVKRDVLERANRNDFMRGNTQPQSVRCTVSQTTTRCATTVSTVTSTRVASTPTTTVTSTSTITSTVAPSATTTVTSSFSTTLTLTSVVTTTTTSTTTSTSVTSTSTVYAACATNNFGNRVNGQAIFTADTTDPTLPYAVLAADGATAYDCCVSALLGANGNVWRFDTASQTCSYSITDTCPNPANSWKALVDATSPADLVWGNAMCGQFNTVG